MDYGYSRKRAVSLRAATIAEVLTTSGYSLILKKLTAAQRVQLQRYLDATVVDPDVEEERNALIRKGTEYYGSLVVIDEAMKRRANRVVQRDYIVIGKMDDRVRLNVAQIIDDTTFAPKTDNPDEAEYLEGVHKCLDADGVWLRLAPHKLVRDAQHPYFYELDLRKFDVWLSLGPEGDCIPTKSGRIDREALLGTSCFGAGYYVNVFKGPVRKALEREMHGLRSAIDDGLAQHIALGSIRTHAAIGVVAVSDLLGGASFPDYDIWDGPSELLSQANALMCADKIYGCRTVLIIAAISVRNAALLVAKYLDDTTSGGASAVKILKVARTAGKVAEVALIVTGVGLVARGGLAVVEAATVSEDSIDALAEREVARYLARNPELASELSQVRLVPGPKGTILGNIKGSHNSGLGR